LREAAAQCQAFSHSLLHDLRVSQVQLDELFVCSARYQRAR
jgi:hypothetical protein